MEEEYTFPRKDTELISKATAKLLLEKGIQTACLIDSSGILVTAGHGLAQANYNVNDIVKIQFTGEGEEQLEAKIIEIVFNKTEHVDFALLELMKQPHQKRVPLQVERGWASYVGKQSMLCGFKAQHCDRQHFVEGKILAPINYIGSNASLIQVKISPESLEGMSGGVICVKNKQGSCVAIGIQSMQPNVDQNCGLFVPFEKIIQKSKNLKTKNFLKPGKMDIDPDLFPATRRKLKVGTRWFLFIIPLFGDSDYEKEIFDIISTKWDLFVNEIKKTASNLNWFKGHGVELDIKKEFVHDESQQLEQIELDNVLLQSTQPINLFRAVFDLSGKNWDNIDNLSEAKNNITHFVGIRFSKHQNDAKYNNPFDLIINIDKGEKDKVAHILLNIIHDIYFDAIVFHSTRYLPQLYTNIEGRKFFSLLKVDFAKKYGLKIYGDSIQGISKENKQNFDLRYLSFLSCCRDSLLSVPNYEEYRIIWDSFIRNEAFKSVKPRIDEYTPFISKGQLFNHLKEHKEFSKIIGQLSETIISREVEKLPQIQGKLYALAISTKKPSSKLSKKNMASNFGHSKCRRMMVRAFSPESFQYVLPYKEYMNVFFFRLHCDE